MAIQKTLERIMISKYDYISILVDGTCLFNCNFCVGKKQRVDKKPFISKKYKEFIYEYAKNTGEFSMSGFTSDPIYIPYTTHSRIIRLLKNTNNNIITSLHTKKHTGNKLFMLMQLYR